MDGYYYIMLYYSIHHYLRQNDECRMHCCIKIFLLRNYYIQVIMPSLLKCVSDESIISVTDKTVTNLLANVKEIHKLHIKLVAEFQQATHPYPYYTNCIGNIFLKYVSQIYRKNSCFFFRKN